MIFLIYILNHSWFDKAANDYTELSFGGESRVDQHIMPIYN